MPDQRSRQERTFPTLHIGGELPGRHVYLHWHNAEPSTEILAALTGLTRKVTRIGHSSSLALVWVSEMDDAPSPAYEPNATKTRRGVQLRIPAPGFLAELDQCFNAGEIDAFFDLSEAISTRTGLAKNQAKTAFEERFDTAWSRSASAPVRLRPSPGRTAHYSRVDEAQPLIIPSSFDSELLVLTKQEVTGARLGIQRGPSRLRCGDIYFKRAKASRSGSRATARRDCPRPAGTWRSSRSRSWERNMPMVTSWDWLWPFLAAIPAAERAACLRGRLFGASGDDLEPELKMGNLGTWTLRREERSLPPLALRSATWCEPSSVWASVTPVVLDRHPKHDQQTEWAQWRDEVAASIAQSCERQGLPKPELIDVDKTSWHRGAPRSRPGPSGMPWLPGRELHRAPPAGACADPVSLRGATAAPPRRVLLPWLRPLQTTRLLAQMNLPPLTADDFSAFFRELWGSDCDPFPWQREFARRLCSGRCLTHVAVPTGSGKQRASTLPSSPSPCKLLCQWLNARKAGAF